MILENENELLVLSGFEMGWEDRDCFLIGQKIRQTFTNKTMGIIAIEMDANAIKSVYEQEILGESGYFTLYDKKGNELFHDDGAAERPAIPLRKEVFSGLNGSYQEETENGIRLVVYDSIENTGWVIVGQVPLQELMAPVYQLGEVFLRQSCSRCCSWEFCTIICREGLPSQLPSLRTRCFWQSRATSMRRLQLLQMMKFPFCSVSITRCSCVSRL